MAGADIEIEEVRGSWKRKAVSCGALWDGVADVAMYIDFGLSARHTRGPLTPQRHHSYHSPKRGDYYAEEHLSEDSMVAVGPDPVPRASRGWSVLRPAQSRLRRGRVRWARRSQLGQRLGPRHRRHRAC